eukprot:m51a1_g4354 hypothetical protein (787) ;mRNA; r:225639-228233
MKKINSGVRSATTNVTKGIRVIGDSLFDAPGTLMSAAASLGSGGALARASNPSEDAIADAAFDSNRFDATAFARKLCETHQVDSLRAVHRALARRKESAARELKGNVYKNYSRFINASKEIASLEAEMQSVRNLFQVVDGLLDAVQQAAIELRSRSEFQQLMQAASDGTASTRQQKERESSRSPRPEDDSSDLSSKSPRGTQPQDPAEPTKSPRGLVGQDPKASVAGVQERGAVQRKAKAEVAWLVGVPDELEVLVAERKFEEAVGVVEALRKLLRESPVVDAALASTELRGDIDNGKDLRCATLPPSHARAEMALLARLELKDRGLTAFFATRSASVSKEVKRLRFEGDIAGYVADISRAFFSVIRATCDDVMQTFPDKSSLCRLSQWLAGELGAFEGAFRKKVFCSEDFAVVGESVHLALYHCQALLPDGFDMSFLLRRRFHADLSDLIASGGRRLVAQLLKNLETETWAGTKRYALTQSGMSLQPGQNYLVVPSKNDRGMLVTDSALWLSSALTQYGNGLCYVASHSLVPAIVSALAHVFARTTAALHDAVVSKEFSEAQKVCALADAMFLVEYSIPRLSTQLADRLGVKVVAEIRNLHEDVRARSMQIARAFGEQRGVELVENEENALDWHHTDYAMARQGRGTATEPTRKFRKLFQYVTTLMATVHGNAAGVFVPVVVGGLLDGVCTSLEDPAGKFWKLNTQARLAGSKSDGASQLVLDMKYVLAMSGNLLGEAGSKAVQRVIERACEGGDRDQIEEAVESRASRAAASDTTLPAALGVLV